MSKSKETIRRVTFAAPGPLYVTNGSFEGEVNLQWDALKNANHYVVEISKNGEDWQQVDIISDPQYSMYGLKSGRIYSFRVSALYSKSQGAWSEPASKKVK